MKNLAFVLSVFVLLMATLPCCPADDCIDESAATEQAHGGDKEPAGTDPEDNPCSPFYSCHACSGFAFTHFTPKLALVFLGDVKFYTACNQLLISTFAPSIWQPPKIA